MHDNRTQIPLALTRRSTWGGRRAGAGRKPGPHPRVPHCRRIGMAARYPAHVTLKLRPGLPSLRSVPLVRALERTLTALRARGEFRLVHYTFQDTHAHLLVEATDAAALGRGMMALGARLARAVNRFCRRTGAVLADRFHLHVLRTPREVRAAVAYVLLNARRHARSRGQVRCLDPASSGRWFDGWRWTPTGEGSGGDVVPVSSARTWLLGSGWRRYGLIDPAEVPGDQVRERSCHSRRRALSRPTRRLRIKH